MRNVIDKIILRVIAVSAFTEGLAKGLIWGLAYKCGWMSAKQINQAAGGQLIKED